MRVTIATPRVSAVRRNIALLLLPFAAYAAVATASLISTDTRSASPPAVLPQLPAAAEPVAATVARDIVVYIAGSDRQKDDLARELSFSAPDAEHGTTLRIIVIEPGSEESLGSLAGLLPEAGLTTTQAANLTLIDAR